MIHFVLTFVSFSSFLALTFFAIPSLAVENDAAQKVTYFLDEIVVTATKTPEKRKDIPNTIIIVNQTDIEASGAGTIGELFANEAGITWQTYGDYTGAAQEIHIRGMKGNATQVFVNGINMNSPSLGLTDVGKIPIHTIERIEVVKGSGSLLYGSGANTINILTKRPKRDKMDLKVTAGYGSQNTYQLLFENGRYLNNSLGYYFTAGRSESYGFRENSRFNQNDLFMKWILNKDNLDISLSGNYIDRSFGIPGVKPPEETGSYYIGDVMYYNQETATLLDNSRDKDGQCALEIKGNPSQWFGYDIKTYFAKMKNNYYERYAYDGSGNASVTVNESLGVTGHVDVYPFSGAKILLGAEYKDLDWELESTPLDSNGSPTIQTINNAHLYTRGFFTEAEYRPSKYIKALAGIRQERHSAFGTENIPLFGVVVNPFTTTVLKCSYGKHFMSPNFNDLYWPEDYYTRGNPNLKPEIGRHFDVTAEQSLFDDKLFIAFSYFRWNIDDKIQWEPDSQGIFSPVNLAGYEADGIEIESKIGPFFNLTLVLSYTYMNAEEESRSYTKMDYGWPPSIPPDFQYTMVKRRATYTPDHQFKGTLSYGNDDGLTIATTIRYLSDMVRYRPETTTYPDVQTVTYMLDSYWITDIKIEQRLFKHWIISLTGKNIFDKSYETNLGLFTDQSTYQTTMCGYPGAGRSLYAGLAYEF